MKRAHTPLLALAFAALLLPSCAAARPAPPAPGQGGPLAANPQHCSYEALRPEEEAELRRALRECASVELARAWVRSTRETERCTLPRGGELDALLAQLLSVPRWYREVYPMGFCYTPSRIETVRFRNAAGRFMPPRLSSFTTMKDCYFYADTEGRPICLAEVFAAFLPTTTQEP